MTLRRVGPALLLLGLACGEGPGPGERPPGARGETVYRSNCIACHALDPGQKGAIGPALEGTSLEVLEARVLRASYPPGYTPRQEGAVMPAFPHLEAEIPALHAYLQAAGRDGG
jgi:mono/diheme cytochrome c family protein